MSKKQHLSRLNAPKAWPIKRKGIKWIAKPIAGTHNILTSMPLSVILTEILKISDSRKRAKYLIYNKEVIVNNRSIKEINFPVGLFDVISFPKINKHYRVVIGKNRKFKFIEIPEKEAKILLLRIENKSKIKKGKIQLNFMNGWNILVSKGNYKTGDVVVYDSEKRKEQETLPLKKGSLLYFFGGKKVGSTAKLEEITEKGILKKQKIAIAKDEKGNLSEADLKNVIVVGKDKPAIKLN